MAINATKDDEELKESIKIEVVKRLMKYLLSYVREITVVVILIVICVGIGIAYPLIIQRILDVEIVNKDIPGMVKMVLFAMGLAVVNLAASVIWRKIMAGVSNDVVFNIRRSLYEHIQNLSIEFFDSRPAGKILARVTGDVNNLKDVLTSTVTQLVPELLTLITVLVVMITVSPTLSLSAAISIPIIVVGVYFCELIAERRWQILRQKDSNFTAFVHENLSGMGVIQSFCAEEEAGAEMGDIVDDHRLAFRSAVRMADLFSPTIEVSYGVGAFVLYYLAIKYLNFEASSIGTLTAFAMYLGMFFGPIRNLANFYNKLVTNMSSAERVFEILDTKPLVKDEEGAVDMPKLKGRVEFRNVSFGYPDEPNKMILKDVNFSVNPGETIALVGPTGAGKTTIISLISRFYNCTSGCVMIDGSDISKVKIKSLRSQLGIMTQDNYLFSGTIKDNLRYGKQDATDEELIAAAKTVHAHDFIMELENGYDTEITERGGGLSAGQRQLIAFARTLVQNPEILILDEATSNIDTKTEILVQQDTEEMLQNRTAFVVAHRLSTIRNADRIFVIDEGGILEQGSHEELMNRKGAYYGLYESMAVS